MHTRAESIHLAYTDCQVKKQNYKNPSRGIKSSIVKLIMGLQAIFTPTLWKMNCYKIGNFKIRMV